MFLCFFLFILILYAILCQACGQGAGRMLGARARTCNATHVWQHFSFVGFISVFFVLSYTAFVWANHTPCIMLSWLGNAGVLATTELYQCNYCQYQLFKKCPCPDGGFCLDTVCTPLPPLPNTGLVATHSPHALLLQGKAPAYHAVHQSFIVCPCTTPYMHLRVPVHDTTCAAVHLNEPKETFVVQGLEA